MKRQNAPVPVRPKKGGSFVWKITLRQTLRTIGQLFWINLLVCLLFWGGVWFCVERAASALVSEYAAVSSFGGIQSPAAVLSDDFFTVTAGTAAPEGATLPHQLTERLSLLDGTRSFGLPEGFTSGYLSPGAVKYVITAAAADGTLVSVAFTAGVLWDGFVSCFGIVLLFEGISVLGGVFKISRSVRKTLRPINQLTLTAHQTITAQTAQPVRKPELQLGSTIDAINAINENRLDTRIDVGMEREELRGLAMSINSMLDRVDFAYRSQLRFVSDASHELRTPIAVIQGYASLLDRWGKEDPKTLDESIAAIKQEAHSMKELVEQLLFLARSDNNSITLHPEVVDLSALTQEVARETGMIEIGLTHPIVCPQRPPIYVNGDIQLLKQLLRVLTDNALKYTPDNGKITLDVKEEGEMAVLCVTDSGIGIGPDDLPKLFDRFYRADASRARQTGGSGLGLSIAKWIIDSHGGTIDVVSREGLGTRMMVKLNAWKAPLAKSDQTP